MRLFRRAGGARPRTATIADQPLYQALDRGTFEDFLGVYTARDANLRWSGSSLLAKALANKEAATAVRIAERALDDGATALPDEFPLHYLVQHRRPDPVGGPRLLTRLVEAGHDVNRVLPGNGPVLLHLGAQLRQSEDEQRPFVDVLLARPELDLTVPSGYAGGTTAIEVLRKWREHRPELVARCEERLARTG